MSTLGDPPADELAVHQEPPSTQTTPRAGPGEALAAPPKRRGGMLWLLAVMAILVAGALFLILRGDDATTPRSQSANAPSGMPMMGGSGTSQAATRTVAVDLGDMYVKPSVSTVAAGKVKFVARNVGKVEHELMVERMPIRMDAPGKPNEDAAMGMIADMGPMHRGQMSLRLTPGKYELFCNVPGHYAAGQHTMLTVTR